MKAVSCSEAFWLVQKTGDHAMANLDRKFWIVPLALWGLYSCWYFGYQSGYSDGHETAWSMAKPSQLSVSEIASFQSNLKDQQSSELASDQRTSD
jgi:hypothetical protein